MRSLLTARPRRRTVALALIALALVAITDLIGFSALSSIFFPSSYEQAESSINLQESNHVKQPSQDLSHFENDKQSKNIGHENVFDKTPDAARDVNKHLPPGLRSPAHTTVSDSNKNSTALPMDGIHYDNYIRIKTWPFKKNAYYIVATTMIRNKARYVPEWIEFHLLQGFDRFVIYDDNSTDGLHDIIDPYIRMGVVEYVRWPQDRETINSSPTGPRVFQDKWQEDEYKLFTKNCIHRPPAGVAHAHGWCQKSSVLDALARYRKHTVWIVHFDIDEFFFVRYRQKHPNVILSDIITVRDILSYQYHNYDHITVPGRSFGTNGFMDEPAAESPELPFPFVFDQYRFCRLTTTERYYEKVLFDKLYTQKSFVKPEIASSMTIHYWTFENKNITPRTSYVQDGLLTMNHYQYRGIIQQNRKARENNHYRVEFSRPADAFLNEVIDYEIGYLAPLVRHNLRQRVMDGLFPRLPDPAPAPWKAVRKPYVKNTKVDICIALVHANAELHKFRKSIHTIVHYLNIAEPSVTYKIVGVARERDLPGEQRPERDHYTDFKHLFDSLDIVYKWRSIANMTDHATNSCGDSADFILYLEDTWETRFRVPGAYSSTSSTVQQPIFTPAMELMKTNKNILEVWVGDTPHHPTYLAAKSEWMSVPKSVISAANKASDFLSKSGAEWANATQPPKWYRTFKGGPKTNITVTRLGGTLRHRLRQSKIGTWTNASESSSSDKSNKDISNDPIALAERFGALASQLDFVSAQFCFAQDPKSNPHYGLDPDHRNDTKTTTGIMWRQHLVFNRDLGMDWLSDRIPLRT